MMQKSDGLRRLAAGLALVGQDMTYEANAMVSTVTDNSVTVSGTGETAAGIRLDGTAG
ncbi:MAG TPA: hypothetical protein IAB92_05735, partial [Candidatus Faecousia faecigallinarum]|nr:hypothetical protein [Candidatus Faecousia faecigallinarum]